VPTHIINFTSNKIEYSTNQSTKILVKKEKIIEEMIYCLYFAIFQRYFCGTSNTSKKRKNNRRCGLLFILFILPYSKGIFVELLILHNILLIFHSYFLLLLHRVVKPCLHNHQLILQSRIALIAAQDFLFALKLLYFCFFIANIPPFRLFQIAMQIEKNFHSLIYIIGWYFKMLYVVTI
jgi:hypothetical protein